MPRIVKISVIFENEKHGLYSGLPFLLAHKEKTTR